MSHKYPQPDVVLGPSDVLGAALLAPAFASDLSTWRLNVHRDGTLTQDVRKAQPPMYSHEQIVLRRNLEPTDVERLLKLATEIGFSELKDQYWCERTDQQHTVLKLRVGNSIKAVNAYGPHAAAYDGDADMKRYIALWDAILELSPFEPFMD